MMGDKYSVKKMHYNKNNTTHVKVMKGIHQTVSMWEYQDLYISPSLEFLSFSCIWEDCCLYFINIRSVCINRHQALSLQLIIDCFQIGVISISWWFLYIFSLENTNKGKWAIAWRMWVGVVFTGNAARGSYLSGTWVPVEELKSKIK